MEALWVILGLVIRSGPLPSDVDSADAQDAAAVDAQEENAAAMDVDTDEEDDEEDDELEEDDGQGEEIVDPLPQEELDVLPEAAVVAADDDGNEDEDQDDDEDEFEDDDEGDGEEAQEQQDAPEENAAAMEVNAEAVAPEEDEPDFCLVDVLPTPQVNILIAGRAAHPDPDNYDMYPYIIAAGPFGLLAHFAVAPNYGTCFDDNPQNTRLVLVRHFHMDDVGRTTATAEPITDRPGLSVIPGLGNIASVGVLFDEVREIIAELQVDHGGDHATLVRFQEGQWSRRDMDCPLPLADREWVPHGAVSDTDNTSICWFDLSWGILSCDLSQPEAELALNFHHLPDGRALAEATPDIHTKRCITVTRDNMLRYVEIVPDSQGGEVPTVTMWKRVIGEDGIGWGWAMNYAMSFEHIWNDHSYIYYTSLPLDIPVLAMVCPSNPNLVYFTLEDHIFCVNVPIHSVEEDLGYALVEMPGPPQPASGRYFVAWDLPPELQQAFDGFYAWQQAGLNDDEEQSDSDPSEGGVEDEVQPVVDMEIGELQPAEINYEGQADVAIEGLQIKADEITHGKSQNQQGAPSRQGDDAGQGAL